MYRVVVKDENYNKLVFRFGSMEEVSVFAETVMKCSVSETSITMEKTKEES